MPADVLMSGAIASAGMVLIEKKRRNIPALASGELTYIHVFAL